MNVSSFQWLLSQEDSVSFTKWSALQTCTLCRIEVKRQPCLLFWVSSGFWLAHVVVHCQMILPLHTCHILADSSFLFNISTMLNYIKKSTFVYAFLILNILSLNADFLEIGLLDKNLNTSGNFWFLLPNCPEGSCANCIHMFHLYLFFTWLPEIVNIIYQIVNLVCDNNYLLVHWFDYVSVITFWCHYFSDTADEHHFKI